MDNLLRVLFIEETSEDVTPLLQELRRGGYEPSHIVVNSVEAMREALSAQTWDIIISDYVLQHFDALTALKALKETGIDLPFIVVSGSIGEGIAVSIMKAGAHDYLVKDNLRRLIPAVQRELREAQERVARRQAEEALMLERKKLKDILTTMEDGVYIANRDYEIEYVNPVVEREFGPIGGQKCFQYLNGRTEACPWCNFESVLNGNSVRYEWHPTNSDRIYYVFCTPFVNDNKSISKMHLSRDITNYIQIENELKDSLAKLRQSMEGAIQAMALTVKMKDAYTAGHQWRVAQLANAIAKELNLSEEQKDGLRLAAVVHDIGKICTPVEILNKPDAISDIEFSLIKNHPKAGFDIVRTVDFPWPVANIVLQHHERINGSGYPQGLKGDQILIEAKVLCVADVVEAMSSHRPYRPSLGLTKALNEIEQNSGILYEPDVVNACLRLFQTNEFSFEESAKVGQALI